jgi:pimeloyl-ACP methyl ester carboxylesterase
VILLVHGGLHGEIDADRFWSVPGIVEDLRGAGYEVLAPDRLTDAKDWREEADWLRQSLPLDSATVMAGSNGCSAALRLTVDYPKVVEKLILCWPATPLAGETSGTVRGVADVELLGITVPVVIVPSDPPNLHHQSETVTRLMRLIAGAIVLPGSPEPPQPGFSEHRSRFIESLISVL